jgi:hypothetical protein
MTSGPMPSPPIAAILWVRIQNLQRKRSLRAKAKQSVRADLMEDCFVIRVSR